MPGRWDGGEEEEDEEDSIEPRDGAMLARAAKSLDVPLDPAPTKKEEEEAAAWLAGFVARETAGLSSSSSSTSTSTSTRRVLGCADCAARASESGASNAARAPARRSKRPQAASTALIGRVEVEEVVEEEMLDGSFLVSDDDDGERAASEVEEATGCVPARSGSDLPRCLCVDEGDGSDALDRRGFGFDSFGGREDLDAAEPPLDSSVPRRRSRVAPRSRGSATTVERTGAGRSARNEDPPAGAAAAAGSEGSGWSGVRVALGAERASGKEDNDEDADAEEGGKEETDDGGEVNEEVEIEAEVEERVEVEVEEDVAEDDEVEAEVVERVEAEVEVEVAEDDEVEVEVEVAGLTRASLFFAFDSAMRSLSFSKQPLVP